MPIPNTETVQPRHGPVPTVVVLWLHLALLAIGAAAEPVRTLPAPTEQILREVPCDPENGHA